MLLSGELGAGKTSLIKGLAVGLGVKKEITSPTFTLMNVYEVKSLKSKVKSLVHIDTYRLKDEKELVEIGVEDYLGRPDTICAIEWPEKIKNILNNADGRLRRPADYTDKIIKISLAHGENPNQRKIEVS